MSLLGGGCPANETCNGFEQWPLLWEDTPVLIEASVQEVERAVDDCSVRPTVAIFRGWVKFKTHVDKPVDADLEVGLIRLGGRLLKQVEGVHGIGAEEAEAGEADLH